MPPEFLDLIYLFPQVSDHVAKFHGDRSRDGGEKLAKEIKKNITSKIEDLPFYRTGGLINSQSDLLTLHTMTVL